MLVHVHVYYIIVCIHYIIILCILCYIGNNTKAFEYFGNSLTYDNKNPKTILAAGSIIQV